MQAPDFNPIHLAITQVIERTGKTSPKDWRSTEIAADSRTFNWFYQQVRRTKRKGKPFLGHGTWADYLENEHGVSCNNVELTENQLYNLVSKGIQQEKITAMKHWKTNDIRVNGHSLNKLYDAVQNRKKRGKSFFGHGSWYDYLEKQHRIYSLDKHKWSSERIHQTIATLIKRYPPEKISWGKGKRTVLHDKSLNDYVMLARRHQAQPFFGHKTWPAYVKHLRETYH